MILDRFLLFCFPYATYRRFLFVLVLKIVKHPRELYSQARSTSPRMNKTIAGSVSHHGGGFPRVLLIDDKIPDPVLGGGLPRTLKIIQTLVHAGRKITFFPLQDYQPSSVFWPNWKERGWRSCRGGAGLHPCCSTPLFEKGEANSPR